MGVDAVGGPTLAAGAAIAWSNAVLPRLARRFGWGRTARSAATLGFCVTDAALARSRFPTVPGLALGAVAALAGVALTTPVEREAPSNLAKWVLVDIPLGTALPEELLFRGAISPRGGPLLGSATFALWHVGAARAARDPVFPTMVVTFCAAAALDALTRRTGRWWPAFLVHWLLNSSGAILSSGSVFSSLDGAAP